MARTLVWSGLDAPRMEIARVERKGRTLRASGTQIGAAYELRYELAEDRLSVEVVGERQRELRLDGHDFFDLGNSPLFNSLPVLRDDLLRGAEARDYRMRWVSVPELEVEESLQLYEPLGGLHLRFAAGEFVADLEFDEDWFVVHYEGLAQLVA